MKSLSFIERFSGCAKVATPIQEEGGIVAVDLAASAGPNSAVLPANVDRARSFTTRGAQGQDRTIDVTSVVVQVSLDLTGAGPTVLRTIVVARTAAPTTIGRDQRVLRNVRAWTTNRRTQPKTSPASRARGSHAPGSHRPTARRKLRKKQCQPKSCRRRSRRVATK
jgi:hypothetical protein